MSTDKIKIKRTLQGTVVSNKMQKTIVVVVKRRVKHQLYGKYILRSSKIHAHDEKNACKVGDNVLIAETKPFSKTKSWSLLEIIGRGAETEQPVVGE